MQGYMEARDYETYDALYQTLLRFLPSPDLVIYLRASVPTLLARIQKRARDYERAISREYLEMLNSAYGTDRQLTLCPVLPCRPT